MSTQNLNFSPYHHERLNWQLYDIRNFEGTGEGFSFVRFFDKTGPTSNMEIASRIPEPKAFVLKKIIVSAPLRVLKNAQLRLYIGNKIYIEAALVFAIEFPMISRAMTFDQMTVQLEMLGRRFPWRSIVTIDRPLAITHGSFFDVSLQTPDPPGFPKGKYRVGICLDGEMCRPVC